MTLAQLERALADYGASYVANAEGHIHFDAPIPLPAEVMNAIVRLHPQLARRCKTPVRNTPAFTAFIAPAALPLPEAC